MPISETDVRDYLAFGHEQSGVEFKSAGDKSDPSLRAKVIRGMLAMANRRDGGVILIGVTETTNPPSLDTLTTAQAASWKHDHLADTVAEYADPRVSFDSYPMTIDGSTIIVIEVREFSDVPVVCKKTLQVPPKSQTILREGAVYVRSNRKPESREIANYDEMRELLEIATDKGVRRFVTRAQQAGVSVALATTSPADDSAKKFSDERGGL